MPEGEVHSPASDAAPISITHLGDFAKPLNTAVEGFIGAIRIWCDPWRIKRNAGAEAEASLIKASTELKIDGLRQRAQQRRENEIVLHQKNIEAVAAKALPNIKESAKPEAVGEDWKAMFFDKARLVCDAEMQTLWGRILAGEMNSPGTYAKRTLSLLEDLTMDEANEFTKICGFLCNIGGGIYPLIFELNGSIYADLGVTFRKIEHLQNIGLVNFQSLGGYGALCYKPVINMKYFDEPVVFLDLRTLKSKKNEISFPIGDVLLTRAGQQLSGICGATAVPGFYDYLLKKWQKLIITPATAAKLLSEDCAAHPENWVRGPAVE